LWVPACATTLCWARNTRGSRVRYEAFTLLQKWLISAAQHHMALQGLCETSFAKDSSRTHLYGHSASAKHKHATRNLKRIGHTLSTNLFGQMTEYQSSGRCQMRPLLTKITHTCPLATSAEAASFLALRPDVATITSCAVSLILVVLTVAACVHASWSRLLFRS